MEGRECRAIFTLFLCPLLGYRRHGTTFLPCCINLKSVTELAWAPHPDVFFIDVCRFLSNLDCVRMKTYMGNPEKELVLELGVGTPASSWETPKVQCILRGQWVENLKEQLEHLKKAGQVFLVIEYVSLVGLDVHGIPTVRSVSDATHVKVDPAIEDAQNKKIELLDFLSSLYKYAQN